MWLFILGGGSLRWPLFGKVEYCQRADVPKTVDMNGILQWCNVGILSVSPSYKDHQKCYAFVLTSRKKSTMDGALFGNDKQRMNGVTMTLSSSVTKMLNFSL